MDSALLVAFLVTTGAGLATGVGAGLGLFQRTTNDSFLALALGFSAGVMLYVSFVEIVPKAIGYLDEGGAGLEAAAAELDTLFERVATAALR